MAKIFAEFIVPIMLAIITLFDPAMPECSNCNTTGFVTCDRCGGDGYIYVADYDVMVLCDDCDSSGSKLCAECPDYAQFYHAFKANLEEYTK